VAMRVEQSFTSCVIVLASRDDCVISVVASSTSSRTTQKFFSDVLGASSRRALNDRTQPSPLKRAWLLYVLPLLIQIDAHREHGQWLANASP
jgi:hypothetical protein